MKENQRNMKPQDVLLLLKIVSDGNDSWNQLEMAHALGLSQSEVSEAVSRSKYAGLLDPKGKKVMKQGFFDFLKYGLSYAFPTKPGSMTRGVSTSHSAPPLNSVIVSQEVYVWPYSKGQQKGLSITPLYPTQAEAALRDEDFHEMLALVDALRVGKARERHRSGRTQKTIWF
jgi:hypothetical protein